MINQIFRGRPMNEIPTVNADWITADCRTFVDGSTRCREELISVTVGRGVYMLGERVAPCRAPTGMESQRYIGRVQSGRITVLTADNQEVTVGLGDFLGVTPNHDAWVMGDEPCVELDISQIVRPQ